MLSITVAVGDAPRPCHFFPPHGVFSPGDVMMGLQPHGQGMPVSFVAFLLCFLGDSIHI
jgi:hypothetical protein